MATPKEDFLAYVKARDEGDDRTRDKLCAQIVKQNTPLVKMLVRRFENRWKTGLPPEDLLQSGICGMLRALTTYDPERSKFSTYSGDWIRKYLQNLCKSEQGDPGFSTPGQLRTDMRNHRDRSGQWPEPFELPQWPERVVRKALRPPPVLVAYVEPGTRDTLALPEEDGRYSLSAGHCSSNELDPETALCLKQGLESLDDVTRDILDQYSDGITPKKIAISIGRTELYVIDAIDRAKKVLRLHLP
jgi:RNA polymerase sigma factor (sigma-70 family)